MNDVPQGMRRFENRACVVVGSSSGIGLAVARRLAREGGRAWSFRSFKGTKWQSVAGEEKRRYLANAYRVLLTRARQGMVIFVPRGDDNDATRPRSFYNETYDYLIDCGARPLP